MTNTQGDSNNNQRNNQTKSYGVSSIGIKSKEGSDRMYGRRSRGDLLAHTEMSY
jgi:hypothetical protein